MATALIVLANIALFFIAATIGFLALGSTGDKLIGFHKGARALVFTEGDRISLRRYRLLSLAVMGIFTKVSGVLLLVLGMSMWSTFALAPTIGGLLGVIACYLLTAGNLKPHRQD